MMGRSRTRLEEVRPVSSPASASGPMLWGRALLLATVALLAGTLAHVGAHGLVPGPRRWRPSSLVGTALCAPLLRTEASRARVVLLVVLGQAGVHVVLTALGGHHGEDAGGRSRARVARAPDRRPERTARADGAGARGGRRPGRALARRR